MAEVVDLTLHEHARRDLSVLVSDDGDEARAVWLPLSLVEVTGLKGDVVEVTMPVWLAMERGLI